MSQPTAVASPVRRRHPRAQPEPERPVRVDINGENFIEVLRARDISEGGIGLYVPHGFQQCQINDPVTLVISLPAPIGASFTCRGRIRHQATQFFGVAFLDLRAEDRALVRRYVSHRLGDGVWWWPLKEWWERLRGG